MATLSVVVPVYNVELYVQACLESILQSTFRDLEVLVVDDGSLDSSRSIIDSIALTDSRVQVITQPNLGLSAARNKGLTVASGRYVCFVDSDDVVSTHMFQRLISAMERDETPVSVCNYVRFSATSRVANARYHNGSIRYTDTSPWTFYQLMLDSVWNKVFERSLLEDHLIRFEDKDIVPQEDFLFLMKCLSHCAAVSTISEGLYGYRIRPYSITNSPQPEGFVDGCLRLVELTASHHRSQIPDRNVDDVLPRLFLAMMDAALNACQPASVSSVQAVLRRFSEESLFEGALARESRNISENRSPAHRAYRTLVVCLLRLRLFIVVSFIEVARLHRLAQTTSRKMGFRPRRPKPQWVLSSGIFKRGIFHDRTA